MKFDDKNGEKKIDGRLKNGELKNKIKEDLSEKSIMIVKDKENDKKKINED